jgi:tRNA threonylcarbamoyladenosine biosynthesis protein TsaE
VSDVSRDQVVTETVTASEEETMAAGAALAQRLSAGDVLLLHGELGAGKTAFVRGVAQGLGARVDDVSSPTFTLIQEYESGRLTLYHVDLYRLASAEVDDLGLEELVESGGIVAIEWPDRWHRRPAEAVTVSVSIAHEGEDYRRLRISYSTL